jgi:phosphomannomutase / phosphoglucomutase
MFRQYDVRGHVNEKEINEDSMHLIGKAFGTFLLRKNIPQTIVGYDFREYSAKLQRAFILGLLSTGCNVIDIGMCLTPMLYFAQYHFKSKGGAIITASHNPNGWSGVKLGCDYSYTLIGDEVEEQYRIIKEDDFLRGIGKYEQREIKQAYFDMVTSKIKLAKPMKIVLECGNGTAGAFAPEILRAIGCEVVELFCNLDATFPHHNPNPESKLAKEVLMEKVKEVGADIGIGMDGDGDRLGVVDEQANNIWSDRVCILLARQALQKHPGGKIVFDIKCTKALEEDIRAHGGIPIIWMTGHSHIKKKCHDEKAVFAGERSGHFFIMDDYYGFDDAVFGAAKLIEYLSKQNQPLSKLIEQTPSYEITPTIDVHCADEHKYQISERLTETFKQMYPVVERMGARVMFDEGWGLVRASSNEPKLVLVFEGQTQEHIAQYKQIFRNEFAKFPEISQHWENE